MNVMVIASSHVLDMLRRFVWRIKSVMPCDLFLLYVGDKSELPPYITDNFKSIRITNMYMDNTLLWADKLRADLLNQFSLKEGLYCDIDIDIIQPIVIPDNESIVWTPDPLYSANRMQVDMLNYYNLPTEPPYAQIGFMYLRANYYDLFMELINQIPIEYLTSFMPGSGIWNIIIRKNNNKNIGPGKIVFPLYEPDLIKQAWALHYTGWVGHKLLPYTQYDYDNCTIKLGNLIHVPSWGELKEFKC